MTQDQIKAIAEKYVEHKVSQRYVWKFADTDRKAVIRVEAMELLQYLSTHYCIVEREKVECYIRDATRKVAADEYTQGMYTGQKILLELLFGVQMFNQNEE